MNETKLQHLKQQRAEIRSLLSLFERAAFHPYNGKNQGDPTSVLNAIHETRVALAKGGAGFLENEEAAKFFKHLQNRLIEIEYQVQQEYPDVVYLAIQWREQPISTRERHEQTLATLGAETYHEAAMFIRNKSCDIWESPDAARQILTKLDKQIEELLNQGDTTPHQTTTVVILDNSQHFNQSGGIRIENEGEMNIRGDVVGKDKGNE